MEFVETSLKNNANYKEFGKFMINMKLLYEHILLCKYKKSYAPVPQIRRTKISDDFLDELLYIFDTGQIDYEKLRELSNEENNIFKILVMKSGLFDKLKYNYNQTREKIDDILEEYDILKGEIAAENDNPEILKKCKSVVKKLFNYGKISQIEYNDILNEL